MTDVTRVDAVLQPARTGPAAHLRDGSWCGYGEPQFWIYDVHDGPVRAFEVHVPIEDDSGPPVVRLRHGGGGEVVAYDARRHPVSVAAARGSHAAAITLLREAA